MVRYPVSRRLLAPALALLLALPCAFGPAMAAENTPLAIKGYDTVAYFTEGKPTPGKPEFEYEWDEQRYRFASAEHMTSFKANPGRYMPRFGNICTGALAYGLAWDAQPELWKIHEGRLYLFGSPESLNDFVKNPQRMINGARRNDARLRKGQPLMAELRFPDQVTANAPVFIKQCRETRAQDCPPEPALADFERLLRTQPKK